MIKGPNGNKANSKHTQNKSKYFIQIHSFSYFPVIIIPIKTMINNGNVIGHIIQIQSCKMRSTPEDIT